MYRDGLMKFKVGYGGSLGWVGKLEYSIKL